MLRQLFSWFSVLGFITVFACPAFAEGDDMMAIVEQLQSRVEALEKKLEAQNSDMGSQKATIQAQQAKIKEYESQLLRFEEKLHHTPKETNNLMEGLEIGAGGTMIVQGANNVNYVDDVAVPKQSRTDASYSADVTLGKEFKGVGGKAFLHLEVGQGSGLEDNFLLYNNVNRDAADSEAKIELTELWYEQGLFRDRVALTFGKLDATAYFDQNEIANDEATQFLGRIFRNSPVVEFPDNGAGIRMTYMPVEWLELGYGLFDGNASWEKVGDNLFNIGQVHFKTNFFELPGNYRVYAWNNNVNHTKWSDTEKTKESSYGFGLSFDQKIHDVVTLFTRYGWQNPEVYNPEITAVDGSNYSLEQAWSAGLQVEGKPWGRENDVLAFAIGQVIPSDDYKKANADFQARTEGHLEAYYKIHVNDYLSVSPDVQYIWNPYGKDIAENASRIFIAGMRAQVDF